MKPQPDTSTQEVLAGLVERVTYHNAENGFCVLRDPLGWTAHVRHDEANPGIKLAGMPLNLRRVRHPTA